MTPRTANRVANAAELQSANRKRKEAANGEIRAKPAKIRKQIVDAETELQQQPRQVRQIAGDNQIQSQSQNVLGGVSLASKQERLEQGLLKAVRFLPRSEIQLRFENIYNNPTGHFFAGMTGYSNHSNKENVEFYAGPPGLPAELHALFKFSIGKKGALGGIRRGHTASETDARKRARSGTQGSEAGPDVELGRDRQKSLRYMAAGEVDMLDFGGAPGLDETDFMGNDFGDLGRLDQDVDLDISNASRAILNKTASRLGTPEIRHLGERLSFDLDNIDRANTSVLNVFDSAAKQRANAHLSTPTNGNRSLLRVPGTRTTDMQDDDGEETQTSNVGGTNKGDSGRSGGWSRNTVKALKILEHELHQEDQGKKLSFEVLANKVAMMIQRSWVMFS